MPPPPPPSPLPPSLPPTLACSADITVTGIASGPAFAAVSVRRHAALRPAAPALSHAVEACPLDVVVWNPGPERARAIADLGDEDWRCYVCVEPGRVGPDTAGHHAAAALAPGKVWTLTQELRLLQG